MDELKKLLESALIPNEAKQVLEAELDNIINAIKEAEQVSYADKLKESMKELQSVIPEMIEEAVSEELEGIAEEVQEARELEVVYAGKLETFKETYDQKQQARLEQLVAEGIAEEIEELKEDIESAKQAKFAQKLVESFGDTYAELFGATDVDAREELGDVKAQLESYQRKEKLNELLESVTGHKRKVAETILDGVPLDRLDEKFESVKSYLLTEEADDTDNDQINEDDNSDSGSEKDPKGTVVIENVEEEDEKAIAEHTKPVHTAISKSLALGKNGYSKRR